MKLTALSQWNCTPAEFRAKLKHYVSLGKKTPGGIKNFDFIQEIRVLAKERHPEYMYVLGLLMDYFFSNGVIDSRKEGERLIMSAARMGYGEALVWCEQRAYNYMDEQNYVKAFPFVRLLARRGVPQMECILALMYEKGDGVEADPAKTMYWLQKVIDQDFDVHGWLEECARQMNPTDTPASGGRAWYE